MTLRVQIDSRRVVLRTPYELSFGIVRAFDSHVISLVKDGEKLGFSEAVPLSGYTVESSADTLTALRAIRGAAMIGSEEALEAASFASRATPFAASTFMTALDVAEGRLSLPPELAAPLVMGLPSAHPDETILALESASDRGITTFKLKIGRDFSLDRAILSAILHRAPAGAKIRVDANQGYARGGAEELLAVLDHPRNGLIEYLEQPLAPQDWEGHRSLIAACPVAVALDESIFGIADIERAAEAGAGYVKLKLMKCFGVTDGVRWARHARTLGLRVIWGNGVATGVGNLLELAVAAANPRLFHGALECNGFARVADQRLRPGLLLGDGRVEWRAPDGKDPIACLSDESKIAD